MVSCTRVCVCVCARACACACVRVCDCLYHRARSTRVNLGVIYKGQCWTRTLCIIRNSVDEETSVFPTTNNFPPCVCVSVCVSVCALCVRACVRTCVWLFLYY